MNTETVVLLSRVKSVTGPFKTKTMGVFQWFACVSFPDANNALAVNQAEVKTIDPFMADTLIHANENNLPLKLAIRETTWGREIEGMV